DIGCARVVVPRMREIGGKLDLELAAQGSLAQPMPQGKLQLRDGKLGPAGQPTIGGIQLSARIAPERIDLDELQARSGDGTLRAKGYVTLQGLTPTEVALDAKAKDFILAAKGVSGAKLNGQFIIRGGSSPDKIQASLKVPDASLWLPKLDTGRKLIKTSPRKEIVFVDRQGLAEARRRERKNVAGRTRVLEARGQIDTFFVRGKDMDLEIDGNVRVSNAEDGRLALDGNIEIR